jgi:hypothetical protein
MLEEEEEEDAFSTTVIEKGKSGEKHSESR